MKVSVLRIFAMLAVLLLMPGCSKEETVIRTLDDAADARIGVMTGSTGEAAVVQHYPAAEVKSFDDIMDAVTALKTGQLDAVVTGYPAALQVTKKNVDLSLVEEPVTLEDTSIAMRKGNPELLAELNRMIADLKRDGTLDDMRARWFKPDLNPYKELELILPESGEPLTVGVSATREPFSFVDQYGRVTGHDGELARIIAIKLNRPLQFLNMKFMALIPALKSGKVDLIITGMTATEERSKSVDFTDSYYANSQVMLVKKVSGVASAGAAGSSAGAVAGLADLTNGRLAVLPGSAGDLAARRYFPSATFQTFTVAADAALAVKTGKADAFVYDKSVLTNLQEKNPGLTILPEPVAKLEIAAAIPKDQPQLEEDISAILEELSASGELARLRSKWIETRYENPPALEDVTTVASSEVLRMGTCANIEPFSFNSFGKLTGLDIELGRLIGERLGRRVEFVDMNFESLIPALQGGKVDFAMSNFNVTDERRTQVLFSRPYVENDIAVLVRSADTGAHTDGSRSRLATADDLRDKRIGVLMGSAHEVYVSEHYPDASVLQYKAASDVALAVKTRKVDAGLFDAAPLMELLRQDDTLAIFGEPLFTFDVAAGFSRDSTDLKQDFDRFLAEIKANGIYDDMRDRWLSEWAGTLPAIDNLESTETLVVGVSDGGLPFVAVRDNELVGFDVELVKRFAASRGKVLRLENYEFGSLIAAVVSGKVDMIIGSIYVTEERQRKIAFSEPYFNMGTLLFARKDAIATPLIETSEEPGFFQGVADSFQSNIMQENRYLLLWNGLKTTVIIAVFATVFGTLLGSVVCFMRMSQNLLLRLPAKVFISILRGTPVLVVLMLIFYVAFASVDIDPVLVAIIAFGLNFAAYAAEIFRTGIQGVDKGQIEAGIAMGFTRFRTFLYIVLPQTIQRILPVYKGEFISLVKMTSIVGYIAVQDLTKASDIIRSRTFDAFFPLVMVAILYFLISWVLMQFLEYLERVTDPRHRRRKRMKT